MVLTGPRQAALDAAAWIGAISGEPRNEVNVDVEDRLSGHSSLVDADVETRRLGIVEEHGVSLGYGGEKRGPFGVGRIKERSDVPSSNHEKVSRRNRAFFPNREREFVFCQNF